MIILDEDNASLLLQIIMKVDYNSIDSTKSRTVFLNSELDTIHLILGTSKTQTLLIHLSFNVSKSRNVELIASTTN